MVYPKKISQMSKDCLWGKLLLHRGSRLISAILKPLNAEKAMQLRGVQKFSLVARLCATKPSGQVVECLSNLHSCLRLSRPGCQPHAARATNERKV